jgi:regulator of extracellular matrix RemA (YlzA/DUF370 family)
MKGTLIHIGFGNVIHSSRVVAIINPGSSPIRKLREEARGRGKLVDATEGRKTRSIIVTDSDHIVLSAIQVETIAQRVEGMKETDKEITDEEEER